MKRFICTLLAAVTVLFSFAACGNSSLTDEEKAEFNVTTDYSDFGFQNMYGMNTWIRFSKTDNFSDAGKGTEYVDFSDLSNAFICMDTDISTLKFSNDALLQERWNHSKNKGVFYDENGTNLGGYKWNTSTYQIIDNYNLNLTSGYNGGSATMSIKDVQILNGIPFISVDFETYWTCNDSPGWYMPTAFIDWSRSPETETVSGKTVVKYYIDISYIKNE